MDARVDGEPVLPHALWWPSMNFGQFRWDPPVGEYVLEIPRAKFVDRLGPSYQQCVAELRADDELVPDQSFPLRNAGYPPLHQLPDCPAAFFEAVNVYLWEDVLEAFIPFPPSPAARFMINSVDAVSSSPAVIVVRGRGYHAAPGFAAEGRTFSAERGMS